MLKFNKNKSEFKIVPGMICAFDPNNEYKQAEYGVNQVIVTKYLGKNLWEVKDLENEERILTCYGKYLYPSNFYQIRYPSDICIFSNMDVEAIEKVIKYINTGRNDLGVKDVDRLKAICEKMKLSVKMMEV